MTPDEEQPTAVDDSASLEIVDMEHNHTLGDGRFIPPDKRPFVGVEYNKPNEVQINHETSDGMAAYMLVNAIMLNKPRWAGTLRERLNTVRELFEEGPPTQGAVVLSPEKESE